MAHKESVAEDEDIAIEATVDVGEMDLDQGTHAIARGPEILAGLPSLSETEYHFKWENKTFVFRRIYLISYNIVSYEYCLHHRKYKKGFSWYNCSSSDGF